MHALVCETQLARARARAGAMRGAPPAHASCLVVDLAGE